MNAEVDESAEPAPPPPDPYIESGGTTTPIEPELFMPEGWGDAPSLLPPDCWIFVDARNSSMVTGGQLWLPQASRWLLRLRTSLAKCRPHALHSVRAPSGPRRHSGVSEVPHDWQAPGAGARLRFLYLNCALEGSGLCSDMDLLGPAGREALP